ncbi:MAG TPA: metallophosphoesterase [Thermoplasmata archaeon]
MASDPAMDLRPIPDHAALLVDGTVLAVADLHIGLEEQLREAGVHLPAQAEPMADEIEALAAEHGARTLVILGDVKHVVPKMASRERRDAYHFFRRLLGVFDAIHVAQGNHDGLLRHAVPRAVHFRAAQGFVLGDVGFCHGHAWPYRKVMASKALVMGHNHPAVLFRDANGVRAVHPCWMRIPFRRRHPRYPRLPREAVVVPALNELCGGVPVNDLRVNFLGPLFDPALLRVDEAGLHLLDGTYLGKLRDLRVDAGFRSEDYRQ